MARTHTRIGLAAALAVLAAAVGCTLSDQTQTPFVGPSELALSLAITANPDTLTRDGASQSLITVHARNDKSQPASSVSLRADIVCVDVNYQWVYADYGTLSAKTGVTGADGRATFVYTAPPQFGMLTGLCQLSLVGLLFTPVGTDYINAVARQVELRLVDPGILVPPSNLTPDFTFTPTSPVDNADVAFDASASTGSIATFSWNFGDGGTGTGMNLTHKFTKAGTFVVTLTVADSIGRTASTSKSVTVAAGTAPTADFDFSPTTPVVNQTVYFNASKSRPAAGRTIVSYFWDFGSGRTATGITTEKAWDTAATYRVTLTVTDDVGRTSIPAMKEVKVETATNPVVAAFSFSPSNPRFGDIVSFNGVGSSSVGSTIVSWTWDFGDASAPVTLATPTTTHVYAVLAAARTYVARLTVTDALGRTATTTQSVTVVP